MFIANKQPRLKTTQTLHAQRPEHHVLISKWEAAMKKSRTKIFWGAILAWILAVAMNGRADSAVQAVSLANPSILPAGGGNNDSAGSVISADGRFVLFLSSASNLATNGGNGRFLDVFLRDRTNNTTTLVSVDLTGTGGGNGHSISPVISTDGRYIAFESEASNLVANDTNGVSDVFLRDLQSGTTRLLSENNAGTGAGNGASSTPLISADGRHVAFVSAASDLVASDTNAALDIFVRDLQTGTIALASVGADGSTGGNGDSDSPALSPDGRWLAFSSRATNLVAGVTNNQGEIYVRDLANGTTTWASANSAAIMRTVTNAPTRSISSFNPVISADGKFVAFKSFGAASLLLRHNLQTGNTDLVSTNAAGIGFILGDSFGSDMTPDGSFIAFTETTGSNGAYSAVYLWDARNGGKTLVSANLTGTISPDTSSDTPAVSADGRFVVFLSDAPDLATNALDGSYQVFLRDTVSGTTRLVSVDLNGGISGGTDGAIPTISADGRYIAFDSFDGGYVPNDNNNVFDVFVRDMTTETTELISQANAIVQLLTADGISSVSGHSLSADGRFIAFVSLADNLAANDTNDYQDVFVRDIQNGTNILVSVNSAGGGSANGFSTRPVISANGRYVAFVSNAPDLTANKTNRTDDIFVRDLQAGTTTLVSVSADGATSGNAESSSPQISSDGRYVVFFSAAKNLVSNDASRGAEIFWRDIPNGLTVSVTTNGNAVDLVSMTADGRYVAAARFFPVRQLFVWDAQTRGKTYDTLSTASTFGFVLSPDGRTLISLSATNTNRAIIVHDLVTDTDRIIGYSATPGGPQTQVSGDGRFVTFVSVANAPNAPNGTNNVFLYDLQTATTTLVSFNRDRTGEGDGPSDSPSISGDGRFITYRSDAHDLVTGDNDNESDVFLFDRLTGTTTLISVNQTGSGPGNGRSSTPVMSADGGTVVFKSLASDLVGGDLNSIQDVFFYRVPGATLLDSDGDGMDDAFEKFYFGDLTHNGMGDSDGDGLSDWMESKTGTDPMNPASRFSPQVAASLSTGQIRITWESTPGRSYRVQYKDDLDQPNWNDLNAGVLVTGARATCWDTRSGTSNQRFYRISPVE
jgi:Tol biopolymer transport system component